jgi:hypothetical protein
MSVKLDAKLIILILLIAWVVYFVIDNFGEMRLNIFPGINIGMPVFVFMLIFLAIGFFLPVLLKKKK